MPRRIPIKVAQDVGQKNQCQQVIILAFDGTLTHIVTWGKSVIDCEMAARGGNILKEKWGWPECNDQPSRVKKLEARIRELEAMVIPRQICRGLIEATMIDLNKVLPVPQRMDLGRAYMESGDLERSALLFQSVIDIEPDNAIAACNAAAVRLRNKQPASAKMWAEVALTIDPKNHHAMRLLGQVEMESKKWGDAESWFMRSMAVNPQEPDTLTTYAYYLQLMGDHKRAYDLYTAARDLNPMNMTARHWRSMTMMTMAKTQAEWDEALSEYELRHLLVQKIFGDINKPMYTGEVAERGNLLLVGEQGVGDAVMMARYVRDLKKQDLPFKEVFILCREPMRELLNFVDGVDGVYSKLSDVPEFSWWTPMMSLLKTEGWPTNQPSPEPYLGGDFMGCMSTSRKNIGICWKGNPEHGNDRYRSVSIETLMRALEGVNANIWSLQESKHNVDFPEQVKAPPKPIYTILWLAEVIKRCDLIVTVDTAVLHIAGAMGVPVFALIPSNPDWRWQTESETTPWYPSVRLFRAKKPLEWDEPLARMNAAIKEVLK